MDIIKQYGTPLKITYLPKITSQIQKAKRMFNVAMAKADYKGKYVYYYCTKSSHFSFVLDEVLKNEVHIETSSAYDIQIIREQIKKKKINRILYLAMPIFAYEKLINYEFVQDIIEENHIKFILFDHKEKIIVAWKE